MHQNEKWKWSSSVVPDSSRPHGPQPTRLLRPWDFPGKSTGVGCHRLLPLHYPGSIPGQGIKMWGPCSQLPLWDHQQQSALRQITYLPSKRSEVAQSCSTLGDPMDCSLPGSSVHGIFQARVLEWVAISFSRGSSRPRDRTWVSHSVGRRFTIWATREVQTAIKGTKKTFYKGWWNVS